MKNLFYFSILSLILNCTTNKKEKVDDQHFFELIESYTSGTISIGSPIKIVFAETVKNNNKQPLSEILTISPRTKGTFVWEDDQTLVFLPSSFLQPNKEYHVALKMNPFFGKVKKVVEEFNFSFKTLKQNLEVNIEGLRFYETKNANQAKVVGSIEIADDANSDLVKELISATQNNKPLEISWAKEQIKKGVYPFSIENIIRNSQQSTIEIVIDGQPIGVSKKRVEKVKIPSIEEFNVLSINLIQGSEHYISVLFSDLLDPKQNLNGLIKIDDHAAKTVIDGNQLKVFIPSSTKKNHTLKINKQIKNVSGKRLKQEYSQIFTQEVIPPEVRLLTKKEKIILPSSGILTFDFEARGLNEVEVSVIKIFNDNVLQYLQINSIGEDRELKRVAKPIIIKTISLSSYGDLNLTKWNTFSINLADIIHTDPGSGYQIKIGFRREHAIFNCSDETAVTQNKTHQPWENTIDWDSFDSYYSNNYKWQERDDSCSDSYYGDRRSIKKILFASDLGIIAKRSDQGDLSVFVSDLITTEPHDKVNVKVYNYQLQQINSSTTNNEGIAKIDVKNKTPFVLVAKKDNQVGYLKLDGYSSLSLSNFDISGTKVKKGLKGFIYGERGVWRPSDTLHLTFILQDRMKTLPEKHPVIMELYNPSGQIIEKKINDLPVGNMYRFDFVTNKEAPTGNWKVKARIGNLSFEKRVKIETVKPNRLKVDLIPHKKILGYKDKNFDANLKVRWLTGITAKNLKTEFEMLLRPVKTTFEGFSNYNFDDKSKTFLSQKQLVFQGRLNSEGNAFMSIPIENQKRSPGALNVVLYGKTFEQGGDFSISQTVIPFYPYSSFVGVSIPEGDKRGTLLTGKNHKIAIVNLDSQGNPILKNRVKVSLYKLSWRWWWDQSYDNLSHYIGNAHQKPEHTFYTTLTNGKGVCNVLLENSQWGRYYIKVEDSESGHSTGSIAYFDWPGWAGKSKQGQLDGATMLDFSFDKEEYHVGEQASITIPSVQGNRVLVSLETGKSVLKSFWVKTESERTNISFKITPDMTPNVYVHLTMIQPHHQDNNDLPIRLYGINNIKVVDPATILKPQINMPKLIRPEQRYSIEVGEENNKAMTYTIAVVDEGLLDLTNFQTPDPWNSFFSKEALSVKTWDLYDHVLNAYSDKSSSMFSIGGDTEIKPLDQKSANRFKPVISFSGPHQLKAGKKNRHQFEMPQYIGSVKAMVVASSDQAYGNTEKSTLVKQELMVLATLPRVIGPNERVKLPVNVFRLNESIKNVSVKVETTGNLSLAGNQSEDIVFDKEEDQIVYFDLLAKPSRGISNVKVTASSGNIKAVYDIEIDVLPRNPFSTIIEGEEILAQNSYWKLDYTPLGIQGYNQATVEISSLPPLNLDQKLDYLINYPHGCAEQLTSAAFPQLFLENLITLTLDQKTSIQNHIESAIDELSQYQTASGGFASWKGGSYPNEWSTNYVAHFLLEAQKLGYAVPKQVLKKWKEFQKKMAKKWEMTDRYQSDLIQAYRLYTLALAGSPERGSMNALKENQQIKSSARWRLALAYAESGFEKHAIRMIENMNPLNSESYSLNPYYNPTFGSKTRDQAMILETLTHLKQNRKAYNILEKLAKKMGSNTWMSTQTSAYSLLAIAKYAKQNNLTSSFKIMLSNNGKQEEINSSDKYVYQYQIPNPEVGQKIQIKNIDSTALFIRTIKKGIPLEDTNISENKNISLHIHYEDLQGNAIEVQSLPKGTSFIAKVTISNPNQLYSYSDLALTQIFPSGWEIINTRMEGSDQHHKKLDYKDIRDDRVMHYFNLNPAQSITFNVQLNATYQGTYYLPNVRVEAMYDNTIYANKKGKWVQVISNK